MIRIKIDNKELYLDPKTSIRLDLVHPAFEADVLHASMIYPFDIPSFKNEHIFKYANHIVVNNKYRIYDCSFSFANAINFTGKLILNKLTMSNFRGSIIMNGFSVDSKDISLKEFYYGNDDGLGATQASVLTFINDNLNKGWPDVKYNFPMILFPNWYGDNQEFNPDFQDYVNNYNRVGGFLHPNVISPTYPENYNSIVPCLFLMFVITKCFEDLGFVATGDFLTHTELSQLMIFYNVPLDEGEAKYTVKASQYSWQTINSTAWVQLVFPDETTSLNQDPDNCWNTSTSKYTIASAGYHDFNVSGVVKNLNILDMDHTIYIAIKDDTDNIVLFSAEYYCGTGDEIPLNISSHDYFYASQVGNQISVYVKATHDNGGTPDASNMSYRDMVFDGMNVSICNFNDLKKTVRYADHLPDMSFGSFLDATCKAFGVYLLFDHEKGIVELNFLKDLINGVNTLDLSRQIIKDTYEIILSDEQGVSIQYKWDGADMEEAEYYTEFNQDRFIGEFDTWEDLYIPTELNVYAFIRNLNMIVYYYYFEGKSSWVFHSYYFKPFIVSPAKEEISIGFSPLMMAFESVGDTLTPTADIKCSSPFFPTGENKCDLHLLFYRGMDGEDLEYPFATSLAYDRFGVKSWDNSLCLDTDNGLYKSFLEEWFNFSDNSTEVKMDFDIDIELLQSIMQIFLPQGGKKIQKIRIQNMNYVPKKFSIMLTMNGIKSCQGNMYKDGMIEI